MTDGSFRTLRFKPDASTRKRLFVPDSLAHPAKGHLGLWAELIQMYTKPGDLVLDPMAGSGATLLGALMGRNVIVNEMEHHFLLPLVRSWAKMRQMPMLGFSIGEVQMLWGDARNLSAAQLWPYQELAVRFPKASDLTTLKAIRRKYRLPLVSGLASLPDASVGAAITSLPFQDTGMGIAIEEGTRNRWVIPHQTGRNSDRRSGYTRPVDAIVTSPPYSETLTHGGGGANGEHRLSDGYTCPVDAIVTSPPYERDLRGATDEGAREKGFQPSLKGYHRESGNGENIGNLRNVAYWDAMRLVYQECFRVLRPGGIMALVLGNFVRDGLIVDLVADTISLCKQQGFQEIDHWQRIKWSLSFWRILQARKGGPVIDREEVVAFRKPYPGSGSQDSLTEKATSPLEASPPVQWHLSSAKLTKDPSQQLPLSLPKEE